MSLQFNPPDWLLRDYINQKRPLDKLTETLGAISSELDKKRQENTSNAFKKAENDRQNKELALKGRQTFYDYGDPSGLSPLEQANLATVQGPQTPSYADQQQMTGVEGPLQNPTEQKPILPAYDPNNPSDHFNEWLRNYKEQNPLGIKGQTMTEDTILLKDDKGNIIGTSKVNRPIKGKTISSNTKGGGDQKRTFQLKGFLQGENGEQIPVSYDTRSGELVKGTPTSGPILPTVAPSIPGAEVSKFGDLENMKEKLKVIDENYSPSFVGMMDAPLQELKQKTGFGATTKAAFFKQATQDIKDSLLRARSGAQINEQEYQRLLPLVPNETMSEKDFLAKRARFGQVLDEMIRSKQKSFSEAGYRPMKNKGSAKSGNDPLGIR